jgi:hypothetical protein
MRAGRKGFIKRLEYHKINSLVNKMLGNVKQSIFNEHGMVDTENKMHQLIKEDWNYKTSIY